MPPPSLPAKSSPTGYARIARLYQALEYATFGRSLEAARATFLGKLGDAKLIGVFGAGDGRCFDSLLPAASQARFLSIDSDAVMTSLARARVARLGGENRVDFVLDDARAWAGPAGRFDAVVTHFFLDCFSPVDLENVVFAISRMLAPLGPWLFADFAIPREPALARWRAQLWIYSLCTFFRWQAGHTLRSLPPMEAALKHAGFTCECERASSAGLIRSAVYRRRPH